MTRKDRSSRWNTTLLERHDVDPLQAQMITKFEDAWRAMWPADAPFPPHAMVVAFAAAIELVDYTLRTERGKAAIKKRMAKRWSHEWTEPAFGWDPDPDLTHNFDAAAIIPGLLAIMQGGMGETPAAGIDTDFEAGIGDAIDGWLAGGAI